MLRSYEALDDEMDFLKVVREQRLLRAALHELLSQPDREELKRRSNIYVIEPSSGVKPYTRSLDSEVRRRHGVDHDAGPS